MKVIIAGSRKIENYQELEKAIYNSGFVIDEVILGGAKGVDSLGLKWCKNNDVPYTIVKAEWASFDRAAGPIRNSKMAEIGDALIAVWDGESRGTLNMIETASKKNLKIYIHYYNESLENFKRSLEETDG